VKYAKGKINYTTEDFKVIYNGNNNNGRNKVAIIVQEKWTNNILNTYHLRDRLLMVKMHEQPTDIYIIQLSHNNLPRR